MSFEFNAGPVSGGKRYVKWKVQGGASYPPENFVMGYGDSAEVYEGLKNGGVIMDIDTLKTGWNTFSGREWRWNENLVDWPQRPQDEFDDWKKGFSVELNDDDGLIVWEQEGASAFAAIERLAPQLQAGREGKAVPKVKLRTVERQPTKKMAIPILEIVEWVDRSKASASSPSGDDGGF